MARIVYNSCYGGFSLSAQADALLVGLGWTDHSRQIARDDPRLLQVIDELGLKACSGSFADLKIRELPPGTRYLLQEYDGLESVTTDEELDWRVA